jgi:glycosyltransferase involved in cell wall biosynthesis
LEKEIKNPLVSIIMPLYNAQNYVAEAIESVINQTYTHWELIIVNDGSSDNSLAVAKQFESDKIKIFTKKNAGAAAARNFGYAKSRGDFIKFFDADDIINPQMIAEQVKLAIQNPQSIISSQWGRFYNGDINTFKLNPEECWQNMNPIDWICSSWKNGQPMTQPGMFIIPKTTVDKATLWDERLTLNDDMEYYTKTILACLNVVFCPNATLYYRSGLPNALSGQKSRKAVESGYLSIELSTQKLLSVKKSVQIKLCCANIWQNFIYEFYYRQPDLAKQAEAKVKELGGSNLAFGCGGYTKMLYNIVGWKLAKWIREKI